MELKQIIYTSQPFGFDAAILNTILVTARRWNRRDDVTGALICRADVYLQMLEGPADKIDAAFERIRRDDRHLEVTMRVAQTVPERLFPTWAMLHDPARSWLWSPDDVAAGALDDASDAEVLAVFTALAEQSGAAPQG